MSYYAILSNIYNKRGANGLKSITCKCRSSQKTKNPRFDFGRIFTAHFRKDPIRRIKLEGVSVKAYQTSTLTHKEHLEMKKVTLKEVEAKEEEITGLIAEREDSRTTDERKEELRLEIRQLNSDAFYDREWLSTNCEKDEQDRRVINKGNNFKIVIND